MFLVARLRVHNFSISLDGYGAGPSQTRDAPLGIGGESLHDWQAQTRSFRQTHGDKGGGTTGPDDDFVARALEGVGAWIIGRNMFGPIRGPWPDDSWRGWWGNSPPFHAPVFVLTHHARAPITMEGGTEYHFVTSGIPDAFKRAIAAARSKDVGVGGGVSTIRQFLEARLVNQMHIAIAPVVLGTGEHLFAAIDLLKLGYDVTEHVPGAAATHVVFTKRGTADG
jgi:dihydrofolate reductase